jgi:hypothetical protein
MHIHRNLKRDQRCDLHIKLGRRRHISKLYKNKVKGCGKKKEAAKWLKQMRQGISVQEAVKSGVDS